MRACPSCGSVAIVSDRGGDTCGNCGTHKRRFPRVEEVGNNDAYEGFTSLGAGAYWKNPVRCE